MCPDFWTSDFRVSDDEFKNKHNDCGTSYFAKLRYQTREGRFWAGETAALGMRDSESYGAVGFVFLSNIVTSVLFVCLCYAQEIESVHEPFNVQVTVYDAGDLPYSVISGLIYALSFVFLADYVFRFHAAVHKYENGCLVCLILVQAAAIVRMSL